MPVPGGLQYRQRLEFNCCQHPAPGTHYPAPRIFPCAIGGTAQKMPPLGVYIVCKMGKSDTCEKQNKKNRSLESEKKNWLLIAISGSGMMDVYQFESTVKIRTHIARQQDELWSYLLKPTWGSIGNLPDVPPPFFIR